jgi:hypothetical protein
VGAGEEKRREAGEWKTWVWEERPGGQEERIKTEAGSAKAVK